MTTLEEFERLVPLTHVEAQHMFELLDELMGEKQGAPISEQLQHRIFEFIENRRIVPRGAI